MPSIDFALTGAEEEGPSGSFWTGAGLNGEGYRLGRGLTGRAEFLKCGLNSRLTMPIYIYSCKKCEQDFEYLQKISDPPIATCEVCGGSLKKKVTAAAFHLKGGGWYKDLYASTKPNAGEAGGSEAKGSSAGEGKAGEGKSKGGESSKSAGAESKSSSTEKKSGGVSKESFSFKTKVA